MRPIVALVSGTVFGAGLTLSGMTDPARVRGFLDVMGEWDPTLILVMASALLISLPAYQWARRQRRPWLDFQYFLPERTRIDRELLTGAALFGIGWGIAGFCPGPAIAALGSGDPQILTFVLAMVVGMALRHFHDWLRPGTEDCRT